MTWDFKTSKPNLKTGRIEPMTTQATHRQHIGNLPMTTTKQNKSYYLICEECGKYPLKTRKTEYNEPMRFGKCIICGKQEALFKNTDWK